MLQVDANAATRSFRSAMTPTHGTDAAQRCCIDTTSSADLWLRASCSKCQHAPWRTDAGRTDARRRTDATTRGTVQQGRSSTSAGQRLPPASFAALAALVSSCAAAQRAETCGTAGPTSSRAPTARRGPFWARRCEVGGARTGRREVRAGPPCRRVHHPRPPRKSLEDDKLKHLRGSTRWPQKHEEGAVQTFQAAAQWRRPSSTRPGTRRPRAKKW